MQLFLSCFILVRGLQGNSRRGRVFIWRHLGQGVVTENVIVLLLIKWLIWVGRGRERKGDKLGLGTLAWRHTAWEVNLEQAVQWWLRTMCEMVGTQMRAKISCHLHTSAFVAVEQGKPKEGLFLCSTRWSWSGFSWQISIRLHWFTLDLNFAPGNTTVTWKEM